MNQQIQELIEQAWDYAYDHETVKGNVANGGFINMNFSDAFSEKFAELLVKECAEVAGCNGHVSGFTLGDLIKEHFGVDS